MPAMPAAGGPSQRTELFRGGIPPGLSRAPGCIVPSSRHLATQQQTPGHPAADTWPPSSRHLATQQQTPGHPAADTWPPSSRHLATQQQTPGHPAADTWLPSSRHLATQQQTPGHPAADTWLPSSGSTGTYLPLPAPSMSVTRKIGPTPPSRISQRCRASTPSLPSSDGATRTTCTGGAHALDGGARQSAPSACACPSRARRLSRGADEGSCCPYLCPTRPSPCPHLIANGVDVGGRVEPGMQRVHLAEAAQFESTTEGQGQPQCGTVLPGRRAAGRRLEKTRLARFSRRRGACESTCLLRLGLELWPPLPLALGTPLLLLLVLIIGPVVVVIWGHVLRARGAGRRC